jgi:hypothetical protein
MRNDRIKSKIEKAGQKSSKNEKKFEILSKIKSKKESTAVRFELTRALLISFRD